MVCSSRLGALAPFTAAIIALAALQLPGGSAAPVITLPSSGDDYPGHALYFDGYSGARSVVNLELQQTAPITQFTVSAWVRIAKHKSHNMLMVSHERGVGFALFVDSGEKLCLGLFRPEGMKTVSSRAIQLPFAWHHVVGTYDGNQSLVYVDGFPGDADPVPGLVFPRLAFTVGGAPDIPNLRLEGTIARVQVWDHARSAAQVAADMLVDWGAPQRQQAGLMGSWRMSEGQGLVVADKSANRRAGQMAGDFKNLPTWVRSTVRSGTRNLNSFIAMPHFATGKGEAVIKLGAAFAAGKLEVVNLPPGGTLQLLDAASGTPTGALPMVPWPLVSGRKLLFVPDAAVFAEAKAARRPVCSSFLLRFTDKSGVSSSHMVEILVGTAPIHLRPHNLNQGCRQARAFQGVTSLSRRAPPPPAPTVSFLVPLSPADELPWAAALQSVLMMQDDGAVPWEVVVTYPAVLSLANAMNAKISHAGAVSELRSMVGNATAARVGFHEMPDSFASMAQLVNQAALLARGAWVLPMTQSMRFSPAYLLEVASQLEASTNNSSAPPPSAVLPRTVEGETGLPLVCPVEGRLPSPAAEGSDEEADVGISHGGSAVCGCGEPNAASLGGLAAAALGLDELWPLMLPGALLPAVTFNTVGGWDESAPLKLYHWDFWLRALESPSAPQPSLLRAGVLTIARHDGLGAGQCGWEDGGELGWGGRVEGTPLLDSVVALLRLRHRRRFGAESLSEAAALVARMAPGVLPTVDYEIEVEPPALPEGDDTPLTSLGDVTAESVNVQVRMASATSQKAEPNVSAMS